MLTNEEKGFVDYWEANRLKKKRIWRQLSVGLPLGVALSGGILVNLYSGWNPAGSKIAINSGFLVLLAAVILIVVFVVIFSAHHRWDMNEQHYKELMAKKDKS